MDESEDDKKKGDNRMKILHCADLHLDSKLTANLDKDRAKERKGEILHTFEKMVQYAVEQEIYVILIAGDLFDTRHVSANARNIVLQAIMEHADIHFYYLRGNHDSDNFLAELEEIPDNLYLFGSDWTSYTEAEGKVTISGMEFIGGNAGSADVSLVLDAGKFNIVMLHGQEAESKGKDKTEIIHLKAFRNKGIDYMALGHIHAYKKEQLDARATYCYPGCLEGRGFDECGEHGFVVLDIDTETMHYTHEFVPFAYRTLHMVEVDVTDCQTTAEMIARVEMVLRQHAFLNSCLLKIVLTGMLDVECEKDISYIRTRFQDDYYFVKVYDETILKIAVESYMLDVSLKGEYVRQVMADDSLSEEDKKIIIRYGLQAIAGEEVQ